METHTHRLIWFEFCEFSSPHDRVEAPSRGSAKDQTYAFLGTQRCSYDINFPLLSTLFLELFRYLVVHCHLCWDIIRRFDLRTRITVQSPHALNPMGAPFSPQLNMGSNYLKSFNTDTTMMRRRYVQMRRHTYHWSFERFRDRITLRKPRGRCTFDFASCSFGARYHVLFPRFPQGIGLHQIGRRIICGAPWRTMVVRHYMGMDFRGLMHDDTNNNFVLEHPCENGDCEFRRHVRRVLK